MRILSSVAIVDPDEENFLGQVAKSEAGDDDDQHSNGLLDVRLLLRSEALRARATQLEHDPKVHAKDENEWNEIGDEEQRHGVALSLLVARPFLAARVLCLDLCAGQVLP